MDKIISPSLEDYLEKILFLYERNGSVRMTDVAIEMNISKPSVNKAINSLKNLGYVIHEHYGLLSLTDKGLEIAKQVKKRHFAILMFLTEILGVSDETASLEACRLEHSMGEETVVKLIDYLEKVTGKQVEY